VFEYAYQKKNVIYKSTTNPLAYTLCIGIYKYHTNLSYSVLQPIGTPRTFSEEKNPKARKWLRCYVWCFNLQRGPFRRGDVEFASCVGRGLCLVVSAIPVAQIAVRKHHFLE